MHKLFSVLSLRKTPLADVSSRSLWSTMLVIGISGVLLINLGRVVVNAKYNYEVYIAEVEGLATLTAERDALLDDLAYYQSYEYKKLYARDYLHLGENREDLYKVVGNYEYFQVNEDPVQLLPETNFIDWWMLLL